MTTDEATARYVAKYVAKKERPAGRGLLERDGLITTAELAAFLSLPVRTLRQWRYLGVGPKAFRVGRHLRYEPPEVRRGLDQECTRGERTA
jgi:Helix-turn-helix domain